MPAQKQQMQFSFEFFEPPNSVFVWVGASVVVQTWQISVNNTTDGVLLCFYLFICQKKKKNWAGERQKGMSLQLSAGEASLSIRVTEQMSVNSKLLSVPSRLKSR